MTHVLVTGADGYVGRALSRALAQRRGAGTLTLLDLRLDDAPRGPGIRHVVGDLGDAAVREAATTPAPDLVFHLAGITSRLAEEQFELGLRANVSHAIALFERLRAQARAPVLVFTSSIGVYGTPLPPAIDDATPIAPTLSYGAQKRMVEILLADYSRRGWLDARSVRLSGVVARPAQAQTALSTFSSDLIRAAAEGRPYTCPIGPDGHLWLLSLPACIDNLLQAAAVPADQLPPGRCWNLPALRASAGEVVQALGRRFGREAADRVRFEPQPALQAQFAQWPPLVTDIADRLGMRHDGDLDTLVQRSIQP
jgi:nucleoside-diphosphate-sugar epimerase